MRAHVRQRARAPRAVGSTLMPVLIGAAPTGRESRTGATASIHPDRGRFTLRGDALVRARM